MVKIVAFVLLLLTLRRNRTTLVPTKPIELEQVQQETDITPELLSPTEVPPVEYETTKHPTTPVPDTKQPCRHTHTNTT